MIRVAFSPKTHWMLIQDSKNSGLISKGHSSCCVQTRLQGRSIRGQSEHHNKGPGENWHNLEWSVGHGNEERWTESESLLVIEIV